VASSRHAGRHFTIQRVSVALDPAKALYWAAVVNGVLAAPLMAVMMLIVRNEKAMGELVLPHRATPWGWAATAVMAAATAIFFWFLFVPA